MTTHDSNSFDNSLEGALEHGVLEQGCPTPAGNKLVPVLLIAAISASGLSMLFSVGTAILTAGTTASAAESSVPMVPAGPEIEAQTTLQAQVRAFQPYSEPNGHPDFERFSGSVRVGMVEETLGEDGLPTLIDRNGSRIDREFTDAAGRPIRPALFEVAREDRTGRLSERPDPRVFSEESFQTWFKGSEAQPVAITLTKFEGEDQFVFDSNRTPDALPDGLHTGVINAELTYEPGERLGVSAADDAWVYIDGFLAIDLGSTHARRMQWADLDRVAQRRGFSAGETVSVQIFFAERRSGDAHLRIESTTELRPAG